MNKIRQHYITGRKLGTPCLKAFVVWLRKSAATHDHAPQMFGTSQMLEHNLYWRPSSLELYVVCATFVYCFEAVNVRSNNSHGRHTFGTCTYWTGMPFATSMIMQIMIGKITENFYETRLNQTEEIFVVTNNHWVRKSKRSTKKSLSWEHAVNVKQEKITEATLLTHKWPLLSPATAV